MLSSQHRPSVRLYYGTSFLLSETSRGARPLPMADEQEDAGSSTSSSSSMEYRPADMEQHDFQKSLQWTMGFVTAATTFGVGLAFFTNPEVSQQFFTTYLLELGLSVDNVIICMYLFQQFQIPQEYQSKVLNWLVAGTLISRVILIGFGAAMMHNFPIVQLLLGVMTLFTALQLISRQFALHYTGDDDIIMSVSPLSRKMATGVELHRISEEFNQMHSFPSIMDGDKLFTPSESGSLIPTTLLFSAVAIWGADFGFATDTIPACLAVTTVSTPKHARLYDWLDRSFEYCIF